MGGYEYDYPGRDIGHVERKARSQGFVSGVQVTVILAIVVFAISIGGLFATGHLKF